MTTLEELAPPRAPAWNYLLGAGAGWDSNLGFDTSAGLSDVGGSLRGILSRNATSPRGQMLLAAGAVGYLYGQQTQYNRIDARLGLNADWRFSPDTTSAVAFRFDYDHSDTSSVLEEQALLLPLARTVGYSGNGNLKHRLSERADLRLTVSVSRVGFPDATFLQNGQSMRLGASLNRRLGRRDTAAAQFSSGRSADSRDLGGESSYWTHYGSGRWTRLWSRGSALLLEGGFSYTENAEAAGLEKPWGFFGGGGLNRRVRRASLKAFARREVTPAFGIGGLRLADRFSVQAGSPIGPLWRITIGADYLIAHVREDAATGGRTTNLSASVAAVRGVSRRLSLSLESRYYRRPAAGTVSQLENFEVGAFLVFGSTVGGQGNSLAPPRM